jgi:hypothetical protein
MGKGKTYETISSGGLAPVQRERKKTNRYTQCQFYVRLVGWQNSLIENMLDENCDRRKQNQFLLLI